MILPYCVTLYLIAEIACLIGMEILGLTGNCLCDPAKIPDRCPAGDGALNFWRVSDHPQKERAVHLKVKRGSSCRGLGVTCKRSAELSPGSYRGFRIQSKFNCRITTFILPRISGSDEIRVKHNSDEGELSLSSTGDLLKYRLTLDISPGKYRRSNHYQIPGRKAGDVPP